MIGGNGQQRNCNLQLWLWLQNTWTICPNSGKETSQLSNEKECQIWSVLWKSL